MRGAKIGGAVIGGLVLLLAIAQGVQSHRLKQQLMTLSAELGTAFGGDSAPGKTRAAGSVAPAGQQLVRVEVLSNKGGIFCSELRLGLSVPGAPKQKILPLEICPGPFPITSKLSFVPRGGAIVLYEADDFETIVPAFSGDIDFKGTMRLTLSMNELELPTKDLKVQGAFTASIAHDLSAYELRYDGDGATWSGIMLTGESKRITARFTRDGTNQDLTFDSEHISLQGGEAEFQLTGLKFGQRRVYSSPSGFDYEEESTGSFAELSVRKAGEAASCKDFKAEGSATSAAGLVDGTASFSTGESVILGRPARLDSMQVDLSNFNQKALTELDAGSPENLVPAMLEVVDEFLGSHPKVVVKVKASTGHGSGSLDLDLMLRPVPMDTLMRSQGRAAVKATVAFQVDRTGVDTILDAIDQGNDLDPVQSAAHKAGLLEILEKSSLLVRDGAMYKVQLSFDGEQAPLINGKILDGAGLQAIVAAQQPAFLPRLNFQMPVVTGPHDMVKVRGFLIRGASQVQQCWQEVPGAALVSRGSLRLSFRIQSDGQVSNARSTSITSGGEIMDACIAQRVSMLEFHAAAATSMVQVDMDYIPGDGGLAQGFLASP